MLYTNKCLEFTKNKRGDKVLEINSLYGHFISLSVDRKMDPKIKIVMNKFHKYLTLSSIAPGRFRLVNKKDDELYIILDLLDYKNFNCDSKIRVFEGEDDFELIKNFKMIDRSGSRKWSIVILKYKPNSDRNSVLSYCDTSGEERFIVVDKNHKLYHINQFKFKHFNPESDKKLISLI